MRELLLSHKQVQRRVEALPDQRYAQRRRRSLETNGQLSVRPDARSRCVFPDWIVCSNTKKKVLPVVKI